MMLFGDQALAQPADEAIVWYDDYDAGMAEARRTGKHMLLAFRCVP